MKNGSDTDVLSDFFERMTLAANPSLSLPEEVFQQILHYIPLNELINARSVSKSWYQHIDVKIDIHLGVRLTSKIKQCRSARNRLWINQENEIQYLKSNLKNIIKRNFADSKIASECEKIRMCPSEASSIALYARELRLDALNEAIIRRKILESEDEWHRFEKFKPRLGKKLDCRGCFLTRFPTSLMQDHALKNYWQTLEFLFLSHNQLVNLPDNMKMPLLKSLEIHGNQLQSLPESIGNLARLRLLDVGNNLLKSLPKSIGRLSSLSMLVVKNNNLMHLPDELVYLKQLKHFYASHNKLKVLPEDVHDLKDLELWDLSHNDLEKLPENMANMRDFQLYLDFNYLQELPFNIERLLYSSHLVKCNGAQVLTMQKQAQKITNRKIVQSEY